MKLNNHNHRERARGGAGGNSHGTDEGLRTRDDRSELFTLSGSDTAQKSVHRLPPTADLSGPGGPQRGRDPLPLDPGDVHAGPRAVVGDNVKLHRDGHETFVSVVALDSFRILVDYCGVLLAFRATDGQPCKRQGQFTRGMRIDTCPDETSPNHPTRR